MDAHGVNARELHARFTARKKLWEPAHGRMSDFRDYINGEMQVPLPELNRSEKVMVANLAAQGLTQLSQRVASITPTVRFPSMKPGVKKWDEYARESAQVVSWWREKNRTPMRTRLRARYLIGYGMGPVMLRPRFGDGWGIPEWTMRNPLNTYPAPSSDPLQLVPDDCFFAYKQPLGWLKRRYPAQMSRVSKGPEPKDDDMFDIVEYVDPEVWVLMVCGRDPTWGGATAHELLEVTPNRSGITPVVNPSRITLDRLQGHYDGTMGAFQQQAMLMALAVIAAQRGVLAEVYLEGNQGETPKIIQEADARTGRVGIVRGGKLRDFRTDPSFMTNPMLGLLERMQRLEGGVPADLGGESASNVRTGRRGDAILSAVIDPPIQEYQDSLAAAEEDENRIAIRIAKSYHDQPKRFFVRSSNYSGEYTPSECFPVEECAVDYGFSGADVNSTMVALGQAIGTGIMSTTTAMERHPYISDVELEKDRITADALNRALLASIEQQASMPDGPYQPTDIARLVELVISNKMELPEAIAKVQREAQERQATPVEPTAPEAQPGLAPPGMGQEQPAIPEPGADINNLASLFGQLRKPMVGV